MSVYQFAVDNMKNYLRSDENQKEIAAGAGAGLDAFQAARVLAIAFMKSQEDVLADLIRG